MPLTDAAIRAARAKQGREIKLLAAYNYDLLYAKIRHPWTGFAVEKQRSDWRSPQYDQEEAKFSRSARLPLARTSKKLGPYMARIDAILAGDSRVYKIGFSSGHWMRKPAEAGRESSAVG